MKKHLILVAALITAVLPAAMTGCRSSEPQPGQWTNESYPDADYQLVDELVRAVLSQKYGYRVISYRHDPTRRLVTYETEWNARDASQAVFSGQGIRRKVWVEVQGVHRDDDAAANLTGTPTPAAGSRPAHRQPVYEEVNGQRLRVVAEIGISVIRERNMSIIHSGDPRYGEWKDAGEDDEELARLLTEIRDRVRDITGRPFGPSPRAMEAHRRYFEGDQQPEDWRPQRERESGAGDGR